MIAGAIAGGALAAWIAAGVAGQRRAVVTRRRLVAAFAAPAAGSLVAPGGPVGPSRAVARLGKRRALRRRGHAHGDGRLVGRGANGDGRLVGRGADGDGWLAGRSVDGDGRLTESCDAIARALRSGRSLSAAVVEAAGRHGEPMLAEIARAVGVGEQLPTAIDRVARRTSEADALLVVQVLAVAAEHGGSQAEAIDRAAATLRERAALRAERQAQAASARLSTRVMTVLPFAFTGFVVTTDGDVREVLFHTPVGWTCLVVGVVLNLAGRAWARRAVAA